MPYGKTKSASFWTAPLVFFEIFRSTLISQFIYYCIIQSVSRKEFTQLIVTLNTLSIKLGWVGLYIIIIVQFASTSKKKKNYILHRIPKDIEYLDHYLVIYHKFFFNVLDCQLHFPLYQNINSTFVIGF